MRALNSSPNVVDNSDPSNYPNGRIKDNDGTGNGTGVNERVYGDLHQTIAKLMRLYEIVPTGLPDNETNGYQIIEALSALASKNDYIYPLTTNGTTTLSIDIKLSLMKNNEFLICLASANKTTETLIKGTGVTSMAVTYSGNFKANEYVRVIKTALGVSIVRVADWNSLNAMVGELLYLKKASQSEENAGTIDTVATTPLVNKVAYTLRTIGADSANYLATGLRNGLYPKEHWSIVDGLSNVAKYKVIKLLSWTADRQYTGYTGFTGSEKIISITPFLECTTANNGYAVGDVVTAPTPYPTDAGRTAEQGIGIQFNDSTNTLFRILVLDQVTIAQAWTIDGATADDFIIPDSSKWAIKLVILYS